MVLKKKKSGCCCQKTEQKGCWAGKPHKYPSSPFITSLLSVFHSLWFWNSSESHLFLPYKKLSSFGGKVSCSYYGLQQRAVEWFLTTSEMMRPKNESGTWPLSLQPSKTQRSHLSNMQMRPEGLEVLQQWNSIFLTVWHSYLWAFPRNHCKYALMTRMSLNVLLRQSHQTPTF